MPLWLSPVDLIIKGCIFVLLVATDSGAVRCSVISDFGARDRIARPGVASES